MTNTYCTKMRWEICSSLKKNIIGTPVYICSRKAFYQDFSDDDFDVTGGCIMLIAAVQRLVT